LIFCGASGSNREAGVLAECFIYDAFPSAFNKSAIVTNRPCSGAIWLTSSLSR
jgi:hypothetical protein